MDKYNWALQSPIEYKNTRTVCEEYCTWNFRHFLNSYNGLLKIDVPYYYYGIRKWGLRLGLEQVKYFNNGKPTSK